MREKPKMLMVRASTRISCMTKTRSMARRAATTRPEAEEEREALVVKEMEGVSSSVYASVFSFTTMVTTTISGIMVVIPRIATNPVRLPLGIKNLQEYLLCYSKANIPCDSYNLHIFVGT